jgi:hypothetical protein
MKAPSAGDSDGHTSPAVTGSRSCSTGCLKATTRTIEMKPCNPWRPWPADVDSRLVLTHLAAAAGGILYRLADASPERLMRNGRARDTGLSPGLERVTAGARHSSLGPPLDSPVPSHWPGAVPNSYPNAPTSHAGPANIPRALGARSLRNRTGARRHGVQHRADPVREPRDRADPPRGIAPDRSTRRGRWSEPGRPESRSLT